MKKILSVLGILLLGLTLVACSKEEDLPTIIIPSEDDKTHLVPEEEEKESQEDEQQVEEEEELTEEEKLEKFVNHLYENHINIDKFNNSTDQDIIKLKKEIDNKVKELDGDINKTIDVFSKSVDLLELSNKKGLEVDLGLKETAKNFYFDNVNIVFFNIHDSLEVRKFVGKLHIAFGYLDSEENIIKALKLGVELYEKAFK